MKKYPYKAIHIRYLEDSVKGRKIQAMKDFYAGLEGVDLFWRLVDDLNEVKNYDLQLQNDIQEKENKRKGIYQK